MAAVLIALGAVILVAGTALYDYRAALIVAGALALAAGIDLARPRTSA